MAECFVKHCLNCDKYSNHRHTPAEFAKPCQHPGCPCRYFFSWGSWRKKYNREFKEKRAQVGAAMKMKID